MNTEPNAHDGAVTVAAKSFWRTRKFWALIMAVVGCCILIGYLIGNWYAASQAKHVIAEQERAYMEASEARKTILAQCLTNNDKLSARLVTLGDKTDTVIDKLSSEGSR